MRTEYRKIVMKGGERDSFAAEPSSRSRNIKPLVITQTQGRMLQQAELHRTKIADFFALFRRQRGPGCGRR